MFDFFVDLFGEIKKGSFRYQVDSGKRFVLQGYKNVSLVTDEKIIVKLFVGELEIDGRHLKIKELGTNTIIVDGSISGVLLVGVQNAK